jgi:hypothetical protein
LGEEWARRGRDKGIVRVKMGGGEPFLRELLQKGVSSFGVPRGSWQWRESGWKSASEDLDPFLWCLRNTRGEIEYLGITFECFDYILLAESK